MSHEEIDRRLVQKGLLKEGQTTDLTASCMWTVTGRQGGKLYKTCTLHGEHKVVPER